MVRKKPTKTFSEAKSKIAGERVRVGGRFVKLDDDGNVIEKSEAKSKASSTKEENYKITEEDRLAFGDDALAFFKWALTKAHTRYEAAKYADKLLRFQHPSLSAMEVKQEIEVTDPKVQWMWGEAQEVLEAVEIPKLLEEPYGELSDTLQSESDSSEDSSESEEI